MSMFAKHMKERRANRPEGNGEMVVVDTPSPDVDPTVETPADVVEVPEVPAATDVVEEPADPVVVEEPVVPVAEEGDDDADGEDEDPENDLDILDADGKEIIELENQINMLSDSAMAIESFGISPSAIGVLKATGLLSGTALESIGMESFHVSGKDDPETMMALEALGEKIKEKAAAWSAKILKLTKDLGTKVLDVLGGLWKKITEAASKIGTTVKETVTAHPYATVVTAIGAVAAVAGIIAFAGGNLPLLGSKNEAVQSFVNHIKSLVDKIKWPFGKIKTDVTGTKLEVVVDKVSTATMAARSGAAKAMGWSGTAVKAVTQHLGRAWDAIKTAVGALGFRSAKFIVRAGVRAGEGYAMLGGAVGEGSARVARGDVTMGRTVGAAMAGVAYVTVCIAAIIKLTTEVILATFKMILRTFNSLRGGKTETPAEA